MNLLGINVTKTQAMVFFTLYLSYVGVYICRKNYGNLVLAFTTDIPESCQSSDSCLKTLYVDEYERLSLEEVGRLSTAFQLAAAASKFVTPVFVDTHSPRLVLSGALLCCALTNIAMSFFTNNLLALTALWGLNGFVNALAWPALSKAFMAWFPNPEQRGRLYSFMSTNQSIGAALAPVIVLWGSHLLGTWKAVMLAPGAVGIVIAALVYLFVKDRTVETKDVNRGGKRGQAIAVSKFPLDLSSTSTSTMTSVLWDEVFTNPAIYMLGICHMCTLLVRDGWSDLSIKYLTDKDTWSYTQESTTKCVWMLHAGGFVGSLVAGWVSDKIYNGKRAPVIGLAMGGCVVPLMFLMQGSHGFPDAIVGYVPPVCFFLLGCFSFTPHVLLGLMARELVSPKAQTTSASVEKFMANLGGAMAGSPLGYVVQTYGWGGGLQVLSTASVLGFGVMVPLWSRGAWVPSSSEKKKKVRTEQNLEKANVVHAAGGKKKKSTGRKRSTSRKKK
jgi:MFS transporter, OPA family, sugar phosphate sensor protein UhpC